MKKIKWGIIGLGNVAYEFAKAFKLLKSAELIGIASKNPDKIDRFKEEFQIKKKYCFSSYESLLKNPDIDIVYIALPNSLHCEWIINSLEEKKKVLVEKPATINFSQIENIKKRFEKKEIFFTEAFMYMYHPQTKKILEIINNGEIGKLISMESNFGHDILTKKNIFGFKKNKKINIKNRLYNKDLGGGAILDLGCYPVSFSKLIASQISEINLNKIKVIEKKKTIGQTGVDIDAYMEISFGNSFVSKISASFNKDLGKGSKIIGSKGMLIIKDTWLAEPSIVNIFNHTNQEIKIESNKNLYTYEIDSISKYLGEHINQTSFKGLKIDDSMINMKILDMWIQ